MNKILLPALAIVFLLIGFFISDGLTPPNINIQSGTWIKQAIALPKVELIDHNGNEFSKQQLEGKWSLLFFGFTHCPDVCPDSLNMLKTMVEHLDDDIAKELQIIFVSVDPARDTSERLKKYVTFFHKDFIGASTELSKLTPLTKKLGIIHSINKSADDKVYDVSHGAAMTLINPQAEYNAVFSPPHNPVALAADLTHIIEAH